MCQETMNLSRREFQVIMKVYDRSECDTSLESKNEKNYVQILGGKSNPNLLLGCQRNQ